MIEGKLVNLRARELSDVPAYHRWLNDMEVSEFILVRYQMSLLAEENYMRSRISGMPSYHDIGFSIETKDGRHIGSTGLHNPSPEDRSIELGIFIGEKDCWGRGLGTDAVRTVVAFAFEEMNLNRVELSVYDYNTRAIRSYERCGFVVEARLRQEMFKRGRYIDVLVMGLLREEWEKTR